MAGLSISAEFFAHILVWGLQRMIWNEKLFSSQGENTLMQEVKGVTRLLQAKDNSNSLESQFAEEHLWTCTASLKLEHC